MMSGKRTYYLVAMIAFSTIIIMSIGSCNKYPEGPKVSIRTLKKRIIGHYTLEKYEVDGIDSTAYISQDSEYCSDLGISVYKKHSSKPFECYQCNWDPNFKYYGTYSINTNENTIRFSSDGINALMINSPAFKYHLSWNIVRLTMKEFWISQNIDGHEYKLMYRKKND